MRSLFGPAPFTDLWTRVQHGGGDASFGASYQSVLTDLEWSEAKLRSYFAQIPKDMEEAAMVDGCSRVGAILRTLLPLSYPALIGAGLYTFLLAWNEFLFAVVLIEAWEKRVITMAIYSLMAEFVTDWSMMMAYSVLASAPLVIAFIFLQRYMVRGMTAGAITS